MIYTLDSAAELVQVTYSRNRNARPSATFRKLRRMRQCQCFGDYPLLATMFAKMREVGVEYNRGQIRRTLDQSPELKGLTRREKRHLMNALERVGKES
jgi:hypothetical protein